MKDRKLRLEDAINATKAAVEEGIVPGGGTTLAHLSPELEVWAQANLKDEELTGALIVTRALSQLRSNGLLKTLVKTVQSSLNVSKKKHLMSATMLQQMSL